MGTNSINLSLFSVLIVLSVFWKPAYSDKCSIGCKGSPTGPTFLNGHKYSYGVTGDVSVFLSGADKQETGVKLLGQVTVTSLGNCVNELVVQNLVISGPDEKKHQGPEGIEKPVRFTIQDGKVGPEICTEEDDSRRSLNIKRAIISLLQTGTKPSVEVDIFGSCPTEAFSSQEGSAVLVHRNRDLSRCAHREQGKNDLITSVYNPTAEIKNSQVLQSTLNVESKVNAGIPEKVSSTEEYLYKPFSVGENGARAAVHTLLTLTGKGKGAATGQGTRTRTIIFENPHGHAVDSNVNSALNAVKETAKTLTTEASSKSAGLFAQLVRILRYTNKDDLVKVYSQVKGNNLEKRVFLDGLLRTGTGYSIEASINILKNKELNPIEQQLVYLSLGNAKHVNNEAIKAATSLLDTPHLPKEVYLGVGALAGAYCRDHDCHHDHSDGIATLSQKLVAKLQNCRPKTKVDEDVVVAVLKGIRNIRHLEDNLIEKLVVCASDNGVKSRVRAAALEAYHADPCSAKLKKSALNIMKNRQLDSEIRIKAYLAVIECPCGQSANEIKNLLDSEPVHQVGRFITSSLRQIRSSANPERRLAQQHYGLIRTPNKFNVDDRKYSFYRELSYNVDALGVGGTVEQTVIYSQDSFLPRSASLNLTTELFGHSFNVLEIGGRQGNLDRVLEHFLGPRSFLRTQDPQTLYDNIKTRFEESKKKVEEGLSRGRRSIKSEVDNFDKHLKAESAPYNNELDLDIYMKLFGTDAVFLSLGDDKGYDFNKMLDQLMKALNGGINQVKRFQQELRAHLLFLDAELAYPTATGLPLKLDLVGSATARLDVATNIDIRQILRSPENAKIDIKLVPSTDIELAGIFLVDANAVATGLKVVTNLHSSTGGHAILKILENGRGFDLQFGLPVDKQEVLTASNELMFFSAERGQKEQYKPIKIDNTRKEYAGCFDQLAGIIGLTLCGEVSVPFALSGEEAQASISKFLAKYPLTGSSSIKLVLEKNDLRGYHVKGVFRNENNEKQDFELLFEAEGSQNRRTQLTGELINSQIEKSLKLQFDSPIKVIHAQVALYRKPTEMAILVKAKYDANDYYARAGFMIQGDEKRSVLKPIIEYQLPLPDETGPQKLEVNGEIIRELTPPTAKYTIKGIQIKSKSTNDVIDINGQAEVLPNGINMDIKARKGEHNLLLRGLIVADKIELEFQNTLNNNVNFKINGHFVNRESMDNSLVVVYGPDFNNPINRIAIRQQLKNYNKSPEDYSVITKNELEVSALGFKVKLDAEIDPKKVDIEAEAQYQNKKADFNLKARKEIKHPQDYSVKIQADYDKQGLEVFSKRDCLSDDKSNFENYVVLKNVGKYELSGVVLHRNKPNDLIYGTVGHFKVSGGGKSEDIKFDVGVNSNSKQYSSHAKIASTKGEFIDYLLKINHEANPNGQLKLVLKDTISANGQFKVNDADGKGNGMLIIDFKQSQRKIKGDVTFVAKDPVFNAEVDIYLNFEKDNNDKVHFTTNNKRTDKLVDSKNKLIYGGKKTEVNVHTEGAPELAGKTHAEVEVVLPTERCLTFKVDRDFTEKDDVYSGHAEILLSDAEKKGGAASIITYKGKVNNMNIEKNIINYEGQVDLKLKDGKQLVNTFSLLNKPEGEKLKYDFKTEVNGNLIPKRASITASGTYLDSELNVDDDYRLKASYGDDIGVELNGKTEINMFENKGNKKYLDYYTVNIRLPFEKAHDIKYVSDVLFSEKPEAAEYNILQSLQVNADQYKLDAKGIIGVNQGNGKLHILIPHVDPFTLETKYQSKLDGDKKTGSVTVKSQYGKGKTANIVLEGESSPQEYAVDMLATAPQAEKLKKLAIGFKAKNPSPDTYVTTTVIDADGKIYKSQSTVTYSKSNPLIDISFTNAGVPSRIYFKGTSYSSSQAKVEIKIENIRDVSMDMVTEGTFRDDNIIIKMTGNSEKLGMKNYKVDISSKNAGNGKRLEFHAENDNKNVLSGSTSLISKKDDKQTIIEGSGSVKVRDEQKSANFKYIRTLLTEGNEQGIETFLNLAIGDRSYVAESRVTNLEFKNSYLYCEEKKQCANVELNSKVTTPKPGNIQHVVNLNFDMRKLGVTPEFGLQITSEVADRKLPQFTLDLHMNNKEKKYHLHMYNQPDFGKFPAGITIALPTRVLALETNVVFPTDKGLPFPIKGELSIHPDKKKPQYKTGARFLVDFSGSEQQHDAVAEFGFSHPKLGKEATVKVRGRVQTPKDKTFKIETSASASHPSIGGDRESKLLLEASPNNLKFVMDTPLVKVIDVDASASMTDKQQQAELKFVLLQGKPVQMRALARDFQYFEFTTEESDRKLSIVGHLQPEKRVDVTADIVLPGEKKNIVHGALFLQDNLVKSDYGFSKDNFNYFLNALSNDLKNLEGRVKQLGEKASADFKDTLKKVEPTLKNLEKAYRDDLKKIYAELDTDKELGQLLHSLDKVAAHLAFSIEEIINATQPIVDNFSALVTDAAKKINDMYEKQIEPQLKQLYETVATALKEYLEGLIDLVAHFAALVSNFFEKHKAELDELTNVFAEIFKDLTRLLIAQLKEFKVKATEVFGQVTEMIKNSPLLEMIKEKYQEIAVPEQVMALILEFHNTARQLMPTEETKAFADSLYQYVEKKLRQVKSNDAAELRVLYEKLVQAVTSLAQLVRAQLSQLGIPSFISVDSLPFISGPGQMSFPSFGGTASFNIITQIIRGEVPDPLALLRAYRIRSFNPLDEVPSKLRAVVVNGQHIFTFDGRHMTFPGHCRYVLAHDHVDRNFTLMMQLQNGLPKALVLEDKSGTTIELKENGQVALNGAARGYPIIEKDSFAFKKPNGVLGLGSLYGIMAFCSAKLEVCYVEVSGFYLGKLRGLLGDGNNEPYDDFRLPNGKISTSEAEFGNAYRLASSCQQVKTPEHSHHQHHAALPPACEQVFGATSTLRPLSLVLDVAPFRQACIHAVSGDAQNALREACQLGAGYAALAMHTLLPAILPPVCVKCTDAGPPKNLGDTYEMKVPNKQADILVIFETTKPNEKNFKDLAVPLISQLVDNLKAKRISDIKMNLVGVTSKYPYPIIYDTDLKLKNPKCLFDDESRYQTCKPIVTGNEKIDKFQQELLGTLNNLRIAFGLSNVNFGFESALDTPFRPGAVRHILMVSGESCKLELDFPFTANMYGAVFKEMAISPTLITVTPGLKVEGKDPAQLVGYTKSSVLMLGEKKQPKDSSVKAKLDEMNYCASFIQEADGLVLSATNYLAMNPGQQKQFLQTAANAMTQSMLHEVLVQECVCTYTDPFTAHSVCVNKSRKEVARRRK